VWAQARMKVLGKKRKIGKRHRKIDAAIREEIER
jgi:hypothetical protein